MSDSRVSVATLQKLKQQSERFAVLTAYDATFTQLMELAGVEVILVGDSLGMVIQGRDSTLAVDMEAMIYHTRCVSQVSRKALVMADMPFMSHPDVSQALHNAARLMREGGAHMVKIESGTHVVPIIRELSHQGVPVCAHLGLLPQSVNKLGGYKVQGRIKADAERILLDATALEAAGADLLLLECVPAELGREISCQVSIPVIGIGAGRDCDAQVLVMHDMLGITAQPPAKFSRNFMQGSDSIQQAFIRYVKAVKEGTFPSVDECYQ